MGISFPLKCDTDDPTPTYNEFALRAAYKPGTIAVTAPSSVIWAVSVGRGNPAADEVPEAG